MTHIVHHGDCLDVMAGIDAESVDAIVTDPPYAVSVSGAVHVGRPGKGSRCLDFFQGDENWPEMTRVVLEAARHATRVLRPNGSMYWYCSHRLIGPLVDLFERAGFKTKPIAWVKKCPAPAPPHSGWGSGFELCLYAYRPGRKWRQPTSDARCTNVIFSDSFRHGQPGKVAHPTQKPVAVIQPLVRSCTDEGDVVLDPFCGSGTTGVVCASLGRRFVGIEREAEYVEIARARIAAAVPEMEPAA